MIFYEDAEQIVRDRLDDITVDDNSRCHWAEVANALTHILGELRAADTAPSDKWARVLQGVIDAYDFCAADPADRGYSTLDAVISEARDMLLKTQAR